MTKIVVNGVDGNFGSQVAKHIQNLLPKDDLLFTAPRFVTKGRFIIYCT